MYLDWRYRALLALLAIQIMLFPAYRSTDFEVHRNWLAITHSLPIRQWYLESTSEWTLDYPPLFAWFEWALSQLAVLADPAMLQVGNLDYASPATVTFQRASVVATGMVLVAAMLYATRRGGVVYSNPATLAGGGRSRGATGAGRASGSGGSGAWHGSAGGCSSDSVRGAVAFCLVVCSAGLIMVDNIHFQYNGLLLGIQMWSLVLVQEGRDLLGGLLFALLLNMKHLFAYAAPAYFVFLLRHYCLRVRAAADVATVGDPGRGGGGGDGLHGFLKRLALLGGGVLAVFSLSLGPVLALGQGRQLLARLFPFGRGLCHAYWAPNWWALYGAADKAAAAAAAAAGRMQRPAANMAGGIVGAAPFLLLPQVSPAASAAAVLLALTPCLLALWTAPRPASFAAAVAYSHLCGFALGYHVHEKAALHATLPLVLHAAAAGAAAADAADLLLLSTAAHVGMFPLLHGAQELPIRWCLGLGYSLLAGLGLAQLHTGAGGASRWSWLPLHYRVYLAGFAPLELYCSCLHAPLLRGRLPFAPLLLTSVYCAVGILWVWARMALGFAHQALCPGQVGTHKAKTG